MHVCINARVHLGSEIGVVPEAGGASRSQQEQEEAGASTRQQQPGVGDVNKREQEPALKRDWEHASTIRQQG